MPQPDAPRMTDDDFRQLVMRTLAAQDQRHADHEARMQAHETRMAAHEARQAAQDARLATHEARTVRMDRQYDKLLEVQLDLARSHDEHDAKMDMLRATLEALKDLLRDRRN